MEAKSNPFAGLDFKLIWSFLPIIYILFDFHGCIYCHSQDIRIKMKQPETVKDLNYHTFLNGKTILTKL